MNVFVLCTGRSGSMTFAKACEAITNYTSAHESRIKLLGEERVAYPLQHIEIDNRLIWFAGALDKKYGTNAFYVHLQRDANAVAHSFNKRWNNNFSIIKAYAETMLFQRLEELMPQDRLAICRDYVDTVNANITSFLSNKPQKMTIHLEQIEAQFPVLWESIQAEGNLEAALATFQQKHNSDSSNTAVQSQSLLRDWYKKLSKR